MELSFLWVARCICNCWIRVVRVTICTAEEPVLPSRFWNSCIPRSFWALVTSCWDPFFSSGSLFNWSLIGMDVISNCKMEGCCEIFILSWSAKCWSLWAISALRISRGTAFIMGGSGGNARTWQGARLVPYCREVFYLAPGCPPPLLLLHSRGPTQ
jgi:hypothetical protein